MWTFNLLTSTGFLVHILHRNDSSPRRAQTQPNEKCLVQQINIIPGLGKLLVHALNSLEGVNRADICVQSPVYNTVVGTHNFKLILGLVHLEDENFN